ncbi:MAG TPA: hypothetical protein PK275_03460 [Chitinophagaceae bacterium]|nr:hypothetical protein [Chitinophagaceae bacterium]
MKYRFIFLTTVVVFTVVACNNSGKSKKTEIDSTLIKDSLNNAANERDKIDPVRDSILLSLTQKAMQQLKSNNFDSLASLVDPKMGLRFSPHAFVDTAKDQVILPATLVNWKDKKKQPVIHWGDNDATGDPIKLTIEGFVKKYIYDANFIKADSIKVNRFIGSGNTLNNLLNVYSDCHFTESYFKGFDKKYEGMDWLSLRLVFMKSGDKYFLVGIVHDAWSI